MCFVSLASGMYTLCESCGKVLCISETENSTEECGIVLPFIYYTHWISVFSRWRVANHFPDILLKDILLKTVIKRDECLSKRDVM